ncbi:uncharacterized protein BXZ73DRAFT_79394 [Epithele typhae]|uniref:uncharacterized protein n=1 Tax=Epithele typhae TaxID=378194 RepID=UPI0020079CFF|nr:uncharacterized protein BXZ73DRAFT_79394 [Epithele typhae]KAH9923695.1 hypothetical protein BXZ73DRAFT_79394 [Epithele typhae]
MSSRTAIPTYTFAAAPASPNAFGLFAASAQSPRDTYALYEDARQVLRPSNVSRRTTGAPKTSAKSGFKKILRLPYATYATYRCKTGDFAPSSIWPRASPSRLRLIWPCRSRMLVTFPAERLENDLALSALSASVAHRSPHLVTGNSWRRPSSPLPQDSAVAEERDGYQFGEAAMQRIHFAIEETQIDKFLRRHMPGEDHPTDTTELYYPSEGSIYTMKSERRVKLEIAKMARSVLLAEANTRRSAMPRTLLLDTSTRFLEDDNRGAGGHQRTRPSLSIYFNTERTRELLAANPPDESEACDELGDSPQTPTRAQAMNEFAGATSYADIVVPIQVKTSHDHAAFRFQSHTGGMARRYSEKGCQSLTQITEYYSAILGRQHRTHLYAVYVCRDKARLLFIDRERCHISEQFVYGTREDQTLHRFFWRLARMDRQQLGFDPSVILADGEDERRLLAHARGMKMADPQRALILRALCRDPKTETYESVSTQWPLQRMTVGSETYVVGRPIIQTSALHGPAPRLFHAFHVEQDGSIKGYTIKDYWRPDHEEIELEHKVYDRLKEAKVTNIPTCVYGGDVEVNGKVQRTKDEGLFTTESSSRPRQAWCGEAKTLHRQIGTNSILILSEFDDATQQITRTALLGDWELSKTKTLMDNATGPRQRAVVGPWYFQSSLSLKYPLSRPYRLSDEVEAFVHVFQYLVLRFNVTQFTNKKSRIRAATRLESVYAECDGGNDVYRGGDEKFISMGYPKPWLVPVNNDTLYDILKNIAAVTSQHYSAIDELMYSKHYGHKPLGDVFSGHPAVAPTEAPSDQPTVAPGDVEDMRFAEGGLLSTHEDLKVIFKKYADLKNWRKVKTLRNGEALEESLDAKKKDPDLFRAAGIIPMDENGYAVIPKPPAAAESGGPNRRTRSRGRRKGDDLVL